MQKSLAMPAIKQPSDSVKPSGTGIDRRSLWWTKAACVAVTGAKSTLKLRIALAAETREQHERGCLLLSANLQRDTKDIVVRNLLRDNQATVEEIFAKALKRAQKQEELSNKEDPAVLARFFVVSIQGMRAMARLQSDRRALEQVAQVALAIFKL